MVYRSHNGINQKWDVVYVDEYDEWKEKQSKDPGFKEGKSFNIVSRMRSHRFLTLSPDGQGFVIAKKDRSPNQLFKFDVKTGGIVTYGDQNQAIAISHSGRNRVLKTGKNNKDWWKVWRFERDGHITNSHGSCMDVDGRKDRENQGVIAWKRYNHNNQKWNIVYVDEDTVQNGLIAGKPFRLLSKMRGKRALTRAGSKIVIMDKNNGNDQIFVFDDKSKSIQPKQDRSLSVDIEDYGKDRTIMFRKKENVWSQHFNMKGEQMVNERGLVFDVAGGKDVNNQKVIVWKSHKSLNQKWVVDYV